MAGWLSVMMPNAHLFPVCSPFLRRCQSGRCTHKIAARNAADSQAVSAMSVVANPPWANADGRKVSAITQFGQRLGLAFQIVDDILDVTQTSEILGKSAGKDVAAKKATYPAVIGLEKSRAEAKRLTREAHDVLSIFGHRDAEALHALANYLLEREY